MTKVLITDGLASDGLEILKAEASLKVDVRKSTSVDELKGLVEDCECLVVRSATKVTKEIIAKAPRLKLICRAGAGVDNVDVAAATERKIAVMNTASANSLAAAEHTIALLFAMFRQVPIAQQSMKESRWDRANFSGFEVTGKTLGILGLGNIGSLVAERALGLKMRVVGFDPVPRKLPGVQLADNVEAVLRQADVLTLHVPLNPETRGWLTRERLELMKDGSWLINCARGGLVDENLVCDLLDSGKLRGVAFDVFAEEPVKYPSRLVSHPKAVVTPHLGASTAEAQTRVGTTAAQQIVGYFTRGDKTGVLNG